MKNSTKFQKVIDRCETAMTSLYAEYPNQGFEVISADVRFDKICKKQRHAENELRYWKTKEIQSFCNYHMYTDIEPFEVVKIISNTTIEVRKMSTVQTKAPKDFTPGGFVGHFFDNQSGQEYKYTSNPDNPIQRVRWSEANKQWQHGKDMRFCMSATPSKFYDYNF